MSAKEVILYDPTADPRIVATGLAPRLSSLRGIAGAPSPTILDALTQCDFALVGSAD